MGTSITNLFQALKEGKDIEPIFDDKDKTPLHVAAEHGNLSVVTLLIARGAKINAMAD